ncbi:MAG: hypothetical protein B6D36_13645, partial [Planctomycetes bacterium UTPLA1]
MTPSARRTEVTDEAGRKTTTTYNTLGRKTRVTEDSAGLAWITDSQFDRADQKRCQDDLLDAS